MTSIHTNTAATAALQTLRMIGSNMAETQQEVSSGLRVGTATDNAAYWSIATTMRSDNRAMSAVSDALGLGAATTQTAYEATSAIVDVLTEYKARLVAAREPGVDKAKVQTELDQLNDQVESIVSSSSFNGVNWLKTDAPKHLMETGDLSTSVVFSFARSAANTVAVKTTEVNLKTTSMLNIGGGGLLQKELDGVGDIGGFRDTGINSVAHQGHETHRFTGPATFGAADYVEFDLVVDAGAHSAGVTFNALRIDKTVIDAALGTIDGRIGTATQMRSVLQYVFINNGVPASAYETMFSGSVGASGVFEIGSTETSGHPGSSIDVFGVTSSFGGSYPAGFALGLEDAPQRNHDNMYPEATIDFTKPFTVTEKAAIFFDVEVGPGGRQTYTIDRTTVDAALGTTDGAVTNAADLATVILYAAAGSGLAVTTSGNELTFGADQSVYPDAGRRAARVFVGNVQSIPPWTLEFDLAEVDVTGSSFTIDEYVDGVEYMLKRSITSATILGALQSRIDMQADFIETLTDTVEKGVGRLVDADMNEASTQVRALQTQQQLAIQALNIANTDADNVMQLFR